MIVKYSLSIKCRCPVDKLPDVYDAEILSSSSLAVEEILKITASFETQEMFQEELTQRLARHTCCQVRTVGWHSGVKTEVVS